LPLRTTRGISGAPYRSLGLRQIFTSAIATVKTSYAPETLYATAAKI